jgi:hypothetical protein
VTARTALPYLAVLLLALLACRQRQQSEPEESSEVTAPAASTKPARSAPPAASKPEPDEWVMFTSAAGRFTVRVPEKPELDIQTVATVAGPMKTHLYTASGSGGVVYQTGYSDFTAQLVNPARAQKLLIDAQNGAAGNLGGIVSEQHTLEVGGHPAREFAMQVTSKGMSFGYWGRLILAGTRLYQLQVIAPGDLASEDQRNRFFGSFEIRPAVD